MNEFDLHMHSCYSGDGQFTPEELIGIAKERGLKTIALSDHDCISGVKEMIKLGEEAGIEVIPAIECSTSIGYTMYIYLDMVSIWRIPIFKIY